MRLTKFVTLAGLMLSLSTAFAQTSASIQGRVANEAEVVQYLAKYMYELKKPYMIFHWFNGSGRNSVWTNPLASNNPSGYDHLENLGNRYYQSFCSISNPSANPKDCGDLTDLKYGKGNMYGPALYNSIDPVATYSYGGYGSSTWVLMQTQLPRGYRVMDIAKDSQYLPQEISNFFMQAKCPLMINSIDALIKVGYYNYNNYNGATPDSCLMTARRILKDHLKMDGFFYPYSASRFQGCNTQKVPNSAETAAIGNYQGPFGMRAFILTNPAKISRTDVKVYNKQTTDSRAERILIYSAFDAVGLGYSQYFSQAWTDITSADKDPNVSTWLKDNVIGCNTDVPYVPATTDVSNIQEEIKKTEKKTRDNNNTGFNGNGG